MSSIIISLISGILLALAFPRMNLHWVAWFAIAPLMYYTYGLKWKRVLTCGLAFGVGYFGTLVYWIGVFGKLPLFLLVLEQSLYIIGFVAASRLIGARLSLWGRFALLPVLWLIFEWIRSLGMLGFTWGDIGYSQYKVLHVIQIAAVIGVWGLSFLLALSNAALANLLTARNARAGLGTAHAQVLIVGLIVVGVMIYGQVSLSGSINPKGHQIRAAVVQGNVDQGSDLGPGYSDRAWSAYTTMTRAAGRNRPDIIVWPETVVPGYANRDWYVRDRLKALSEETHAHLLVGGWDQDSAGKVYNSVFLFAPKRGMVGKYAKVHLVPFGEFVPARKHLPFLQAYHVTAYDTSPGSGFNVIQSDGYAVGTAICFESIFHEIPRRLTAAGADILCIVTNDCWYDHTPAAEQHMAFSVFRAVENRRWLLRGATTGISCIIDPCGRIVAQAGVGRAGVVQANVEIRHDKSFFTTHGDWVLHSSFAVVLLMAAAATSKRSRSVKRTEKPK